MSARDVTRARVLTAAAHRFAVRPFAEVSMADVAHEAGVSVSDVSRYFGDTHAAAVAVLDHERASMHGIQRDLAHSEAGPLGRIVQAFRAVGANLAHDVVIRAGVCLAASSRHHFPERRLDPFGTWLSSIEGLLRRAQSAGELRGDVRPEPMAWAIVAAGMGTMDFARTQNRWAEIEDRLERTAQTMIDAIAAPSHERLRVRS